MKLPRIGYGYDTHTLQEGRPMMLGGVLVPSSFGPMGHSDADVLLHAITDAVLGAAALRDIGYHFPDTDPAYKGADSTVFLRKAVQLVAEKGYQVSNVDSTVVLEKPKLKDHIPSIAAKIAEIMGLPTDAVNVKATTNEKMDAVGQGLSIVAHAAVLIYPADSAQG